MDDSDHATAEQVKDCADRGPPKSGELDDVHTTRTQPTQAAGSPMPGDHRHVVPAPRQTASKFLRVRGASAVLDESGGQNDDPVSHG